MFKKLKEKLADEVKANPRLQGTLDSVNQLAVQTYSNFTKEGSGSRDSLTSLSSQLSNVPIESNGFGNGGSSQSDLVSLSSPAAPANSVTSSSGQFFSLGEDDDPISLSNSNSPLKTPTPPTSQGENWEMLLFFMWYRWMSMCENLCNIYDFWRNIQRRSLTCYNKEQRYLRNIASIYCSVMITSFNNIRNSGPQSGVTMIWPLHKCHVCTLCIILAWCPRFANLMHLWCRPKNNKNHMTMCWRSTCHGVPGQAIWWSILGHRVSLKEWKQPPLRWESWYFSSLMLPDQPFSLNFWTSRMVLSICWWEVFIGRP